MASRKTIENQYHPQTVSHPGRTLEEKLQEMGMSVREFAIMVARPEGAILSIIKGHSPITPEYAVIFENITQIPAHFWLARQRNYDEYMTSYQSAQKTEGKNLLSIFHKRVSVHLGGYQYGGTTN